MWQGSGCGVATLHQERTRKKRDAAKVHGILNAAAANYQRPTEKPKSIRGAALLTGLAGSHLCNDKEFRAPGLKHLMFGLYGSRHNIFSCRRQRKKSSLFYLTAAPQSATLS